MCGIAGFYGFRDEKLIKQFSKDLEHRGPDGDGYFMNDTVSLMNRRLAIIDRSGGWQPIYNEDDTIAIVYNGEIYNFEETHDKLVKLGHTFKTKCDTEVVIHAYEEWGEKSFDRHNGMFAFALYDIKKDKLILARDHFGIKPLHFAILTDPVSTKSSIDHDTPEVSEKNQRHTSGVSILFSSEIKPIINSGLIKKKVNEKVLYRYLKYRVHDNTDETFFDGVKRLLPGEYMVIEKGKYEIKTYTNLRNDLEKLAEEESKEQFNNETIKQFRSKLVEAVRLRLISEVPVGSCLSGGLDSSTVVAITNQLLKEKVKEAESVGKMQNTFSAVFPGSNNDEERYIDSLIEKVKHIQSHKVQPTADEFFHIDLTDFIRTQEEPIISSGHYAQYKVMQKAHEYVTVVLDGQGSDEMMAGYLPYYFVYLNQLKKEKKYGAYVKEIVSSLDVLSKYGVMKLYRKFGFKKDVNPDIVLKSEFRSQNAEEKFKTTPDNLKKRLLEDIFENSVQSLLRYEDRDAMRFSIEGRVPFLDFNLLKYIFSLPDEAIIESGWNKNILRKAVSDLLPEMIVKRRNKIGFTTPENEWFLRMKNMIYSVFLSESFANRPYFNQSEVLKQFEYFIQGKNDDSMMFWRMLNVELWLREFFDSPPSHQEETSAKQARKLYEANEGKKIEIKVEGKTYHRVPIRTELFKKGDDFANEIKKYVDKVLPELKKKYKGSYFLVVSEKVVAICQGRSYFIWDINPGFFAKTLSKFVKRTPYGIGLGSPWTMQIAIDEVGLSRILFATAASVVTKPFGVGGMFYRIAGPSVRSIDGPTEYSLYPSNVSAKLGPKDPQKAAEEIKKNIISNFKFQISNFQGVVIIDSNDLGRDVLGNATRLENKLIAEIFRDNPMGQGSEQTPLVIVFY